MPFTYGIASVQKGLPFLTYTKSPCKTVVVLQIRQATLFVCLLHLYPHEKQSVTDIDGNMLGKLKQGKEKS